MMTFFYTWQIHEREEKKKENKRVNGTNAKKSLSSTAAITRINGLSYVAAAQEQKKEKKNIINKIDLLRANININSILLHKNFFDDTF